MALDNRINRIRVRKTADRLFLDVTHGNQTATEESVGQDQLGYMLDQARALARQYGLDHFINEFGDKVWVGDDEAPKADRYPARSRLQREIARLDVLRAGIIAQVNEVDTAKEALEEILNATVNLYHLGEEEAETYLMSLTDKYIGRLIDKKLLDGDA